MEQHINNYSKIQLMSLQNKANAAVMKCKKVLINIIKEFIILKGDENKVYVPKQPITIHEALCPCVFYITEFYIKDDCVYFNDDEWGCEWNCSLLTINELAAIIEKLQYEF